MVLMEFTQTSTIFMGGMALYVQLNRHFVLVIRRRPLNHQFAQGPSYRLRFHRTSEAQHFQDAMEHAAASLQGQRQAKDSSMV
jgi:hypothetical protein